MLRIDDKIINPSNICYITWSSQFGFTTLDIFFTGDLACRVSCASRDLEPLLDRILNAKC